LVGLIVDLFVFILPNICPALTLFNLLVLIYLSVFFAAVAVMHSRHQALNKLNYSVVYGSGIGRNFVAYWIQVRGRYDLAGSGCSMCDHKQRKRHHYTVSDGRKMVDCSLPFPTQQRAGNYQSRVKKAQCQTALEAVA